MATDDAVHTDGSHAQPGGHDTQGVHDQPHMPHESGKWWKTVAILVSAGLIVSMAVGSWSWWSSVTQRIHDLEQQVKDLSDRRAEKSTVTQLQSKMSELAEKSSITQAENKLNELTEKVALAVPTENELDHQREEITNLRVSTSTIFAGYNNTIGKFDTMLNNHEREISVLRGDASVNNKVIARLEAILDAVGKDVGHLKTCHADKTSADLTALKERLARLEAVNHAARNTEEKK